MNPLVAQKIEQLFNERQAVGLNPTGGIISSEYTIYAINSLYLIRLLFIPLYNALMRSRVSIWQFPSFN